MIGYFLAVLNLNRLFLKLNWFICNWLLVLPDHSYWSFKNINLDEVHLKLIKKYRTITTRNTLDLETLGFW